jgi:hypothetical protein
VQILVEKHLLTLRGREVMEGFDRGVDQSALERPSCLLAPVGKV